MKSRGLGCLRTGKLIWVMLTALAYAGPLPPSESAQDLLEPIKELRITEEPDPKQNIDRNVLLVNGNPFLPIIIYHAAGGWAHGYMSDEKVLEVLKEVKDYGFNTVDNSDSQKHLDEAWSHNLYSIAGFNKEVINHPSVLAWSGLDEPNVYKQWTPERCRKECYLPTKEQDKSHPYFQGLAFQSPLQGKAPIKEYLTSTDIAGIWVYPVPFQKLSMVAEAVDETRRLANDEAPVWIVLQLFAWHYLLPYPTPEQERYMTYSALIHGAKGLGYFAYHASESSIVSERAPELWRSMKGLLKEVNFLAPVILSVTPEQKVKASSSEVEVLQKDYQGKTYVFAACPPGPEQKIEFSLPGISASTRVRVLFDDREIKVKGDSFSDTLGGCGTRVYEIEATELKQEERRASSVTPLREQILFCTDQDLSNLSGPLWKVTGTPVPGTDPATGAKYLLASDSPLEFQTINANWQNFSVTAVVRLGDGTRATLGMFSPYTEAGQGVLLSIIPRDAQSVTVEPLHRVSNVVQQMSQSTNAWLHDCVAAACGTGTYEDSEYLHYRIYPDMGSFPAEARAETEKMLEGQLDTRARWFTLKLELNSEHLQYYIDGKLVAELRKDLVLGSDVVIKLEKGTQLKSLRVEKLPLQHARYYTVDIHSYLNHSASAEGLGQGSEFPEELFPPGLSLVDGVPFLFFRAGQKDNIDLGKTRWVFARHYQGNSMSPWFRGAFCGDPNRVILRVPRDYYKEIKFVCAADTESNSTPKFTVRLFEPPLGFHTDFVGQSPYFNETRPDKLSAGIKAEPLEAGGKTNLWLVTVPLNCCEAQDFVGDPGRPTLDIELTREVHQFRTYPDPYTYDRHPAGLPSAVHIFAMTLVREDVKMVVKPGSPCFLFEQPDEPTFRIQIENRLREAHKATLILKSEEFFGEKNEKKMWLDIPDPADGPREYAISFPQRNVGHYRLQVQLKGTEYELERRTSFLYLPPDDRQAEAEDSPFGIWWRHRGMPKEDGLVALERLGVRWQEWPTNEPEVKKHKLKRNFCGLIRYWDARRELMKEKKYLSEVTGEEWQAWLKKKLEEVEETMARYGCETFLIFHEDAISADFNIRSSVFADNPPREMTSSEKEKFEIEFAIGERLSRAVRERFPNVKLCIGNTSHYWPIPFMTKGYPRELIDFFGIDVPFFERMPERPPRCLDLNEALGFTVAAKKFGYDAIPLVGTEFLPYPVVPGALSEGEGAAYYQRLVPIALAVYNYRYFFSLGKIIDTGSPYNREHYGSCGYLYHAPECNPKVCAASIATMSRILDGPIPERYWETGSLTTFCVGFKRKFKPGLAIAAWTVRGERPLTLWLDKDMEVIVTKLTGKSEQAQTKDGKLTLTVSMYPVWLEGIPAKENILKVEAGKPTHETQPAPGYATLETFDEKFAWEVIPDRWIRNYELNQADQPRVKGELAIAHVASEERKSKVIQVSLVNGPENAGILPVYSILRHTGGGIMLPGSPTKIGFHARGNSGWQRVIPVLDDASGQRWMFIGGLLSTERLRRQKEVAAPGMGGYQAGGKEEGVMVEEEAPSWEREQEGAWNSDDTHSWSSLNFDGWRYMELELPYAYPGDNAKGAAQCYWRYENGDGIVHYPLKLTHLIVEMYTGVCYMGKWLDLPDGQPIQIDDIVCTYDDPFENEREWFKSGAR